MSMNVTATPDQPTEMPEAPAPADKRIAHFKAGYDNSQAVVRFLDAKATAVVSVVPIVIGALTAFVSLIKDWARWETALRSSSGWIVVCAIVITVILAIAMVALGIYVVLKAFCAIIPRPPKKAMPSIVFPYQSDYSTLLAPDNSFAARLRYLKNQGSDGDLLEDYERQLLRMSEIVREKLTCTELAVKALRIYCVSALVVFMAIASTAITSGLVAAHATPAAGISQSSATKPTS